MTARVSRTDTAKKVKAQDLEQQGKMKMALALVVSLNNDTLCSLLGEIEAMLKRDLPPFHCSAMLDWRRTVAAELNTRGIFTA